MKINIAPAFILSVMMFFNYISPVFATGFKNYSSDGHISLTKSDAGDFLPNESLSGEVAYNNYTDVSHISDEDFFGVWDSETETWIKESKINYGYSPELAEVEHLVKLNSYSMAKDELLNYYKNRTNVPLMEERQNPNWTMIPYWMRDVYQSKEDPLAMTTITNAEGEYQEYKIDLGSVAVDGVFVLSAIEKTSDMIEIASRETDLSPSLIIESKDGSQRTIYPSKDTYIRGYDTVEDYRNEIYGSSEKLYVKDSYQEQVDDNGAYQPFSSKSRRTYIAFASDDVPSNAKRIYLSIFAKIVSEDGAEQTTDKKIDLVVFDAYNKSWEEVEAEDNEFLPMTWGNYKQAHYSWDGIPGGFDNRNAPKGLPGNWYNGNVKLINALSLSRAAKDTDNLEYMKKSVELLLDFISDTNGLLLETGVPKNRDIESCDRLKYGLPMIGTYLKADAINGEALSAILKWIWEEMTYLYNGAGCLFEGATDIPTSNNYAETNRAIWHCDGMEMGCIYYPEFKDRDMWKELADIRLKTTMNKVIDDDGSYVEPTFSYANSVFNDTTKILENFIKTGSEMPEGFEEKVRRLGEYIMNISFPNHIPPNFGEGDPSSTIGTLKQFDSLFTDDRFRYVVTNGEDGLKPDYTSMHFETLHLVTSRTDWATDASMLMMNAKNGGNHNHKDAMHLMYHFDGVNLLDDTGMTSYDSTHPHFEWQRHTTRSHNTIEIDGIAQRGSDFLYNNSLNENLWNGLSDLDLYKNDFVDRIVAWTDATDGFRHYRNVSYIKNEDFIIVSDMVQPSDENVHTYTQNWHTYANENSRPTIDNITKTGRTNYTTNTPNLIIAQANSENLNVTLEKGYSKDAPDPTKYFCYTQKAAGPVMYNTVLYPVSVGDTANISVENLDTGVEPAVASAMNINVFKNENDVVNVFYYNSFEEVPTERSFNGYTTNSSNVTVQQDIDKVPTFLSMYNGSKVLRDGDDIISSDVVLEDIEIVFEGSSAIVTSADENILSAKLIFIAPQKIRNVTLNGINADFIYSDGKVYINTNENVDFTSDRGYFVHMTGVNATNSYPITLDIPESSVISGTLSMPECVNTGGVFNVSFGNATLTSCVKITVGGHTNKNVVATLNGVDRNITMTIPTGSIQNTANGYVSIGAPVLERAREDLVIWTKDATTFKIGASNEIYGDYVEEEPNIGESSAPGYKDLPPATGGSGSEMGSVVLPNVSDESKDDSELQIDKINFTDCYNHWAEDNIRYMYSAGYVNGISKTEFAPDAEMTRAEFAAIASRILELKLEEFTGIFSDVNENQWFASTIEAASNAGIIRGADGLFKPDDNITREEMAVILMRIYRKNKEYEVDKDLQFSDKDKISDWAIEAVSSAYELGLVKGVEDGRFAPSANTTRAQAVTVFKRLLDITQAEED